MGISTSGAGQPELRPRRVHRRALGPADRPDDDDLLRLGLPDRPEGLRRRDLRRPRELSGGRARRALRRPARELRLVLRERVQGSDRLHADHPGAALALVPARPRRTRRSDGHAPRRPRRLLLAFALLLALLPLLPVPEFWITQANYIGLYTLVVLGLVLLTGIAGLTSFGQAAFVGLGAYTAAYLTVDATASRRGSRSGSASSSPRSPRWCSAGSRCACRATTCRSRRSRGGCRSTTCSATSTRSASTTACSASRRCVLRHRARTPAAAFFYLLWAIVVLAAIARHAPARFARRPRAARGEGRHDDGRGDGRRHLPRQGRPRSCSRRCSRASRAGCSRTSSAP